MSWCLQFSYGVSDTSKEQKSNRIRQWLAEVCCLAGLRFCWTAGLCSGVELCRTRPLPRPWFPPCCWKTAHRGRHWLTFCWRERLLSISSSTNRSMVRQNSEYFYIYMPRPLASSKERECNHVMLVPLKICNYFTLDHWVKSKLYLNVFLYFCKHVYMFQVQESKPRCAAWWSCWSRHSSKPTPCSTCRQTEAPGLERAL